MKDVLISETIGCFNSISVNNKLKKFTIKAIVKKEEIENTFNIKLDDLKKLHIKTAVFDTPSLKCNLQFKHYYSPKEIESEIEMNNNVYEFENITIDSLKLCKIDYDSEQDEDVITWELIFIKDPEIIDLAIDNAQKDNISFVLYN